MNEERTKFFDYTIIKMIPYPTVEGAKQKYVCISRAMPLIEGEEPGYFLRRWSKRCDGKGAFPIKNQIMIHDTMIVDTLESMITALDEDKFAQLMQRLNLKSE